MSVRVVIAGGSGQVGTILARAFHARGDHVVVLSRTPRPAPWKVVDWDAETIGPWAAEVDGADVAIGLAGRNVNCRYTSETRRAIMDSRVLSTRVLGRAIASAARPPAVWLQASTATIYAHRFDAPNDEYTGVIGGDEPGAPASWKFSVDVARAWEEAAEAAGVSSRLVKMRTAVVMSPDRGGPFDILASLARKGLGGTAASGRQWISWVHYEDLMRAIDFLIQRADLDGAINIAAPNPLSNAQFMRALRAACHAPIGLPAAGWMLELGAMLMGTETELVLKSRRVVPARLLDAGFRFTYPDWPEAARDLAVSLRT
jgi:uncharacterized protein (TIGR01777 family)